MNNEKDSEEMLDWDKKNITRFAQFLYDLAKERVQTERVSQESIDDEVVEELELEPEVEVVEELELEPEEEIVEELELEPEEEIVEELELEPEEEIVEKLELEPEEEIVEKLESEDDLEQELEEVTIGLAKAVSGEEVGEIDVSVQEEIQEIIEKEQIPIPSENLEVAEEAKVIEIQPQILKASEIIQGTAFEEKIAELASVDLSEPIVTDPVIDTDVLIQPENIPDDIHNLVFVEETTSVPITKDEIIIKDDTLEIEPTQEPEVVQEQIVQEQIVQEPEVVQEQIVQEPEVVQEQIVQTDLEIEAEKRRQEIIDQMLADTKKREEEEDFQVRALGETEGRSYSAVVFGNESNKNIKKWKKWERRRLKEEKKQQKKKK